MFTVYVQGLQFHAYHGVPAEERVIGHRYLVDVSMEVDGHADETDAIADTVDYAEVSRLVEHVINEADCQLVERLAGLCADLILERFPLVESVTVTVNKPYPPMPHIAAFVGAEVRRPRAV